MNKLNSRPRKYLHPQGQAWLGFKTSYQVSLEVTGFDARPLEVVRL